MHLRKSIWFLLSVMFLRSIANSITQPIVSIYIRSLGFSIKELGFLSAGLGIGLLIFEPVWGLLSDRGFIKKIFVMSSFLTPLITLSYTVLDRIGELFIIYFINGAILCAFGVSSRSLVSKYTDRRGRAFGLWYAIMGIAGLIGPTIGGYLAGIEYKIPFYASVIASLGALLGSILLSEPKDIIEKVITKERISPKSLLKSRAFITISILTIFPLFTQGFIWTFLPIYANESPRLLLNPLEIGLMFTVMSIVSIPTQLFFGEISDRTGRKSFIILGLVLHGLSFLLFPKVSFKQIYFVVAAYSVGSSAVGPIMLASMVDKISSSQRGTAIGIYGAFEDIGVLIGPLITGSIYQQNGPTPCFYLCSALMFFTAFGTFFYLEKG